MRRAVHELEFLEEARYEFCARGEAGFGVEPEFFVFVGIRSGSEFR